MVTRLPEVAMHANPGLVHVGFNFTAWGSGYTSCKSVARQLRKCFERYSGTTDGLEVLDIYEASEIDLYDDRAKVFYRPVDFDVWHRDV